MRTIAINILILSIGVLILEIVFGDWWIDNQLYLTRIPRNVEMVFDASDLYQDGSNIKYSRDQYGLRGRYADLEDIDILTIGGSTTDQRNIDDELTWQSHMIRQIFNKQGKSLTIVNAGVDGQTTFGHIANFQYWFTYIPKLRPKFILFYIGLNDKWKVGTNRGFDDLVQPQESTELGPFERTLLKSALYNAWLNVTGLIVQEGKPSHLPLDWKNVQQISIGKYEDVSEQELLHLAAYKKRVIKLIDLAKELGADSIIVNQKSMLATHKNNSMTVFIPDGWDPVYTIRIARLEKLFGEATVEACKQQKAICINLYEDLQHQLSVKHFYDLDHNNPEGTKLLGEYLANKLMQNSKILKLLEKK